MKQFVCVCVSACPEKCLLGTVRDDYLIAADTRKMLAKVMNQAILQNKYLIEKEAHYEAYFVSSFGMLI